MNANSSPVSVVGLGSMGIALALALALLRAGVRTTVWNRAPQRARPLANEGAVVAPDLAAAVAASDLVIVCLRDHAASREVLATLDATAYDDRIVVNLSSSTPGEGRDSATWGAEREITYLSGAIMVPTPMIGTPEAVILYSGDQATFEKTQDRLLLFAGVADYLGDDPGRAALYDVAMLEIFFAAMTSFLHAAAMVTAHGITATAFLPYARQMTALGDIVHTSDEMGLDGSLARHMHQLARRAVRAGHGTDSYSRVIDMLRPG